MDVKGETGSLWGVTRREKAGARPSAFCNRDMAIGNKKKPKKETFNQMALGSGKKGGLYNPIPGAKDHEKVCHAREEQGNRNWGLQ